MKKGLKYISPIKMSSERGMMMSGLKRLFRRTDWKHFFDKNGVGEIVWLKERGWLEHPNCFSTSVFYVSGKIKGGFRGEGFFTVRSVDYEDNQDARNFLSEEAVSRLKSYALPDCRCRMGLHWKCGIHHNWIG